MFSSPTVSQCEQGLGKIGLRGRTVRSAHLSALGVRILHLLLQHVQIHKDSPIVPRSSCLKTGFFTQLFPAVRIRFDSSIRRRECGSHTPSNTSCFGQRINVERSRKQTCEYSQNNKKILNLIVTSPNSLVWVVSVTKVSVGRTDSIFRVKIYYLSASPRDVTTQKTGINIKKNTTRAINI